MSDGTQRNAESGEQDENRLGWHTISGVHLLEVMRRCSNGEDADLVYAEMWANADHENVAGDE